MVHSPESIGKPEIGGFDAFLPLIGSGISLYIWEPARFFATVLFTCKGFDNAAATDFTRQFLHATEIETRSF